MIFCMWTRVRLPACILVSACVNVSSWMQPDSADPEGSYEYQDRALGPRPTGRAWQLGIPTPPKPCQQQTPPPAVVKSNSWESCWVWIWTGPRGPGSPLCSFFCSTVNRFDSVFHFHHIRHLMAFRSRCVVLYKKWKHRFFECKPSTSDLTPARWILMHYSPDAQTLPSFIFCLSKSQRDTHKNIIQQDTTWMGVCSFAKATIMTADALP